MNARRPRSRRDVLQFPDHPFAVNSYLADTVCLALETGHPAFSISKPYRHWRADAVRRFTGCLDACAFASGVDFGTIATAVAAHALAHYSEGGWDFIVKCWTQREIVAELRTQGVATRSAAIGHFAAIAALLDERRAEVRAEAW